METSKTTLLIVTVQVKPGSKKGPLIESLPDRSLRIYTPQKAIDGAANTAVITLLAVYYNVPKSHIHLVSGPKSKIKRFTIS